MNIYICIGSKSILSKRKQPPGKLKEINLLKSQLHKLTSENKKLKHTRSSSDNTHMYDTNIDKYGNSDTSSSTTLDSSTERSYYTDKKGDDHDKSYQNSIGDTAENSIVVRIIKLDHFVSTRSPIH